LINWRGDGTAAAAAAAAAAGYFSATVVKFYNFDDTKTAAHFGKI